MSTDIEKTVYTAWYHNGFFDDPPELLGICCTERLADLLIEYHKKNRDTEMEFEDEAVWYKRKWTLIENEEDIKEKQYDTER